MGRGSAPADLNAIPLSAVDHIEVLRDGASARYGSDAIAGVINVILKHADHGGSISTKFGEYKKGDGIQRNVSGNTGLALGDNGFINLSAEGADNDYTNRAGDDYRTGSVGSTTYGQRVFRQGEPATNEGKFQFNSEYSFNDAAEFYTFGGYSKRRGETAAFYRASNASNNIPALNPNGYLPLIKGNLEDTSLVVGLRGLLAYDWHYDLSANYGKNQYALSTETINTSLGLATPRKFDNGTLSNDQKQVSLDLSREFDVGWLPYPVSVAFGGEYLHQGYEIEAGEPASYFQTGSSGLGGFRMPTRAPALVTIGRSIWTWKPTSPKNSAPRPPFAMRTTVTLAPTSAARCQLVMTSPRKWPCAAVYPTVSARRPWPSRTLPTPHRS